MTIVPHIKILNSDAEQLIETALGIKGKVEFTKENPIMEIPVKGKIILKFDYDISENLVMELELAQ